MMVLIATSLSEQARPRAHPRIHKSSLSCLCSANTCGINAAISCPRASTGVATPRRDALQQLKPSPKFSCRQWLLLSPFSLLRGADLSVIIYVREYQNGIVDPMLVHVLVLVMQVTHEARIPTRRQHMAEIACPASCA